MSEHCCGKSHNPKGFGVFTNQYMQNIEMNKLNKMKLYDILNKLNYEDRAILELEFNSIKIAGNEVSANNHLLRSKIIELESQVTILTTRIKLVRDALSLNKAKSYTYFPRDSEFTKFND